MLTLNMKKTEFLLTGWRQRLSNVYIVVNEAPVKQVLVPNSLCVNWIRMNIFRWFVKKVASVIAAIKRVRNFVPRETFLTIFCALLQPRVKYCSTVWANCNKSLQKLQNRAARIITSFNYGASLDELPSVTQLT